MPTGHWHDPNQKDNPVVVQGITCTNKSTKLPEMSLASTRRTSRGEASLDAVQSPSRSKWFNEVKAVAQKEDESEI